jgi:hypothetical protein
MPDIDLQSALSNNANLMDDDPALRTRSLRGAAFGSISSTTRSVSGRKGSTKAEVSWR